MCAMRERGVNTAAHTQTEIGVCVVRASFHALFSLCLCTKAETHAAHTLYG